MATEPQPPGSSTLGDIPATFTYTEALASGLTDRSLAQLRDSGDIEQISRGLYRRTDAEPGADWNLLEVAHRAPRGTLCLSSALARHGLTDLIPGAIDIAIPRGSTRPKIQAPVAWHHFAPETFELGRSTTTIDRETEIGIYKPERSIIDAFRLRRWEGPELGVTALRRWLRRPGSRPSSLLAMAASFPATVRPIRETLEILL
jgi:predicted transcriptional regulator of viral defense system